MWLAVKKGDVGAAQEALDAGATTELLFSSAVNSPDVYGAKFPAAVNVPGGFAGTSTISDQVVPISALERAKLEQGDYKYDIDDIDREPEVKKLLLGNMTPETCCQASALHWVT